MHVLILGARAPACLEWARAFADAGWQVTVADSLAWPLARASRASGRYLRLPEPRTSPHDWIAALRDAVCELKIDLLLPTCEEVFYLAHGAGQLRDSCRLFTSDFKLLHTLHHKGRFADLVKEWPVRAPETHMLTGESGLQALPGKPQQWVFKPAYSRFASRTLVGPDSAQLTRMHPTAAQPWVAQRLVTGREHCSFSLLVEGRLHAHACYHPRHRVGRGSGIYFEPTFPTDVRAFVEHFGVTTGYTGQVGFDFMEDENGRFHVLECNPRATSGIHLFGDQPHALVSALTPEYAEAVLQPGQQPRMIALAMLVFAATRNGWRSGFWRDYLKARDVVLRGGDWGPLLAQLPGMTEIMARALRKRCGLLAASTADIEWDGQPLEGHVP